MNTEYCLTPFGWVSIVASPLGVASIRFVESPQESSPSQITQYAKEALGMYLGGHNPHPLGFVCAFTSPLAERVLRELATLPLGEVITYKELGDRVGGVHPRAIARIMASNRIVLLYPCHRVVAQSGLGGYSGGGLERKQAILDWEQTITDSKPPQALQ